MTDHIYPANHNDTGQTLSNHQIEKHYRDARAAFASCVESAKAVSVRASGRYVADDQKAFWASVLFTKLVVIAFSILRLCPRTSPIPERHASWNFSAVAALSRNLMEAYIVFFYLCVDQTADQDEWLVRLNLVQLRDNMARLQMFRDLNPDDPHLSGFAQHHDDLTGRLKGRKYFSSLPEKRQIDLLKGEKAMLFTHEEVFERMGEDYILFRGLYRYSLSS